MAYESCVLGADGRCTRWSHDHEPDTLPGSDNRCETCGRLTDCCGNCPKGCGR